VPPADPYAHAIRVLKQYGCWDKVPESVRAFLRRADPAYLPLQPEEWHNRPRYCYRSTGPEMMLAAALASARGLGLNAAILASSLNDLPAQPVAEALATIALEVEALDQPLAAPCALLCGGELVVATGEADGLGGRNQEFVLAAATRIKGSQRVVIASADSDGADGPTPSAGGIVDGETLTRAQALGVDVAAALARHDSHTALAALGDTIETGILRTNVRDLRVMYVAGAGETTQGGQPC
jgi:hydroxypyruvate reductase